MRHLLDLAAPWLCLIWLLGIVFVTIGTVLTLREDEEMQLMASMAPWRLIIVAVSCVAWPGLLIFALALRSGKKT